MSVWYQNEEENEHERYPEGRISSAKERELVLKKGLGLSSLPSTLPPLPFHQYPQGPGCRRIIEE
jgi:hypothetical protein